jgi:hypothetical protein
VVTPDPERLPDLATWYLSTNLPAPASEREVESDLAPELCSKVVDRGSLEEGGVPSPVTWKKRRHTDAKDTPRR